MGGAVFPPWGQMVGVMATSSKRTYASQCPWPHSRPLLTHASARDSQTLTGKSGSVSCGVTAPFSWVLVRTVLFVPLLHQKGLYNQSDGFSSSNV